MEEREIIRSKTFNLINEDITGFVMHLFSSMETATTRDKRKTFKNILILEGFTGISKRTFTFSNPPTNLPFIYRTLSDPEKSAMDHFVDIGGIKLVENQHLYGVY